MIITYKTVLASDTKNILRDSALVLMLVVPFFFIPLVRFGAGALVDIFPEIEVYVPMSVMLFGAMVAVFPAFVMGFVMMDEKDGGINQILRVLPFSLNRLIGLRVLLMVSVGFINCFLFLGLNGLVKMSLSQSIMLSLNAALFAPISAFLMLCISANKIEAAAVLKGISFVTFFAFLQFFIPGWYKYLLSPLPTFWLYRSFEEIENMFIFSAFNLVGFFIQLIYLYFLWKFFLKRW